MPLNAIILCTYVTVECYNVLYTQVPLKYVCPRHADVLRVFQVKAWVFPKGMTPFQRIRKGFASVAWSFIVLKVSGCFTDARATDYYAANAKASPCISLS